MDDKIISYTAIALSVATAVIGVINHKRIRSNCCGKRGELSLDISPTHPIHPIHPAEAKAEAEAHPPLKIDC